MSPAKSHLYAWRSHKLSEYELTSLALDLFRDMDGQIKFWLEATFAVLVAAFLAGDRLSGGIRWLIVFLYGVASTLAGLRYVLTLRRNLSFRDRLLAEGYSDIPTDWWLVAPVTFLILIMFLGGVLGTIYFVSNPRTGRAGR